VAGVLSAGVALAAGTSGVLDAVERSSIDARFSIRGARKPPSNLAVVGIDGPTFSELRTRFPFSRRLHAALIRRLAADGAKVIAYDVQFTEPTQPAADSALLDAIAAARNVVLVTTEVGPGGRTDVLGGDAIVRSVGARVGDGGVDPDPHAVVRRLRYQTGGLRSFSVVVAETAGRHVSAAPFGSHGAWIDYVGGAGAVPAYSFSRVLDGRVPAAALRGRIVVVGATAPTLGDVHATPVAAVMSGAEVEANMIDTVLRGIPLRSTGWALELAIALVLGLAAPLLFWRLPAPAALLAALAAGALFAVGAQVAFDEGHIVPVAEPLLALALGTISAVAAVAVFAALDRERVRTLFERFVPATVVDQVLARADGVRLGGTRVQATVVFCDLRGSTALIESLGAEAGIELVNRYLTEMTDAVLLHGGTLAGFRGDGLLALFGAPLEQPDHARRGVAAAREMLDVRLPRVNEWARSTGLGDELRVGIGVCSGELMAGNVGSEQRMEYTVVGDAANIAARLQAMTKGTPHQLYVAESTWRALGDDAHELELVGDLVVRGARQRVRVWAPAAAGP